MSAVNADAGRLQFIQSPPPKTQSSLISADQAASIARRATGGRVLGVKLKKGKRPVYQVKVLLNSERVRTVTVDATNGNLR